MALTPNTNASSYLPVGEFLKRSDLRLVGDLCSDTGVRVTAGALSTDPNLAAALLDASGLLEAAVTAAGRYQPSDLVTLLATSSAGQALVYRLLKSYTILMLWDRRPEAAPYPERHAWAEQMMADLHSGERTLPFLESQQAGLLTDYKETPLDVENRNLTTFEARRFYGRQNNRFQWPEV
jgi:hypothetical protein